MPLFTSRTGGTIIFPSAVLVTVEATVNVMHGLCVGVITDTLVITELRGVRVVQIP